MIVYIVLGAIAGIILSYIVLHPKIKQTQQLDKEIELKNRDAKTEIEQLNLRTQELIRAKEELVRNNDILAMQAEQQYQQQLTLLEERFGSFAEDLGIRYQKTEQAYQKEYLSILEENTRYFLDNLEEKRIELEELTNQLHDIKSKVNASVEGYKRMQADKDQQNFYRLTLSDIDIQEILKLREVEQYLRDSTPLNKVIWSVYYERPYTDLVGRVLGNETHTGIYKLTNTNNNMCYIGQAVNIGDRWKQHIKCGIGADIGANNKLYAAMKQDGPEAFTFEMLEECDRELLNEREQYWQDFFKAKEFGYSIK